MKGFYLYEDGAGNWIVELVVPRKTIKFSSLDEVEMFAESLINRCKEYKK